MKQKSNNNYGFKSIVQHYTLRKNNPADPARDQLNPLNPKVQMTFKLLFLPLPWLTHSIRQMGTRGTVHSGEFPCMICAVILNPATWNWY